MARETLPGFAETCFVTPICAGSLHDNSGSPS